MSNTELVRKAIDAVNRHDAAAFAANYAPDALVHDPYYAEPLRGREAVQKDMEDFFRAFPDINIAVRATIEDGALVATQAAVTGTHKGVLPLPTGDIPATGRKLSFDGAHFTRVNGQGLIVEEHRYYDVLGQLAQLGLLPETLEVR